MAILLPNILLNHEDEIHSIFRVGILTPRVSYLKQWRTLHVEK